MDAVLNLLDATADIYGPTKRAQGLQIRKGGQLLFCCWGDALAYADRER